MIALPPKFLTELEKAGRKPFALLEIEGAGQSDEATTEAHWGAATSESNVDYTSSPLPPPTGDVIIAAAAGTTTTANVVPTGDGSTIDADQPVSNVWANVDDDPHDSDTTRLRNVAGGQKYNLFTFVTNGIASLVPDSIHIEKVTVGLVSRKDDVTDYTEYGVLRIGGADYSSASDTVDNTSYILRTYDFTTDPTDSEAWTKEKLATIQEFGARDFAPSGNPMYITQVYLTVTYYDFETSGNITVELDLSGANTDNNAIISIDDNVPTGAGLTYELYYFALAYMRPTNHYDVLGQTANEADAYDADDTDASTTNVATLTGYSFYVGRDSANNDAWQLEPSGLTTATMKVVAERIAGTGQLSCFVANSGGQIIASLILGGGSAIAKQTFSADVSGYIGDLADLRIPVFGASTGTTEIKIYDTWIEGNAWGDAVAIQDGSRVPTLGFENFRIKSSFTSDGTVTSILKSIGIVIPDSIYRFSTLSDDTLDAQPLLAGIPGRNVKLSLKDFVTDTSAMNVKLVRNDHVDWMLRNEYFRGLSASIRIGMFYNGITVNDLIPYYQGRVDGYGMGESEVSIKLKDATKDLNLKWPVKPAGTAKPTEPKDGTHMVQVIEDIIDDLGILARYVDRGSLATVKANVGDGSPASANYKVKRTGATAITKQEPGKKYVGELAQLLGAYLVIQENGKLQLLEYDSSASAVDTWDDNVIFKGAAYDPGLEALRNNVYLYFDWLGTAATGGGGDGINFSKIKVTVDATSVTNWSITSPKIIESKWIHTDYDGVALAVEIAAREVARLKDGVGVMSCTTSLDRAGIQVGDIVEIDSALVLNPDVGEGSTRNFLVTEKTWDVGGGKISWKLTEAR